MGLIRAAITFIFGIFLLSIYDQLKDRVNTIPVIGPQLHEKMDVNKVYIFIIAISFLHFIL